jgi:PAS domain S-box-containing protein
MGDDRIDVVVADDDAAVREALADLIASQSNLRLVGLATDHEQTVREVTTRHPHVLIMDVRMPNGDAPGTVRALRERAPGTRTVVLSAYEDLDTVLDVLAAGAVGYLVKGVQATEILEAVRRAARGQFSMSAAVAAQCAEPLRRTARGAWSFRDPARGRAEESLPSLLGQAPCGVLVLGTAGRIEFANEHAQRAFDHSLAELRDRHLRDLLPERFHVAAEQMTGRLLTPTAGMAGRRRDGTEFPAMFSGGVLEGGHPRSVLFVVDLSEARAAEDRFRRFVEHSPDAMVTVDTGGRIRMANSRTAFLFGYELDQLTGRSLESLIPGQPLTVSLREWSGPQEEPSGHSMELVGRRSNGSQFPADVSVSPLHTSAGPLSVLTIRDITEVQRAQFILERSLELLEGTDRDRQALLSHLVHAQEQERGRIAADIHDDTIQVITATSLRLQQLRRRLREPEDVRVMDKLEDTLKQSLNRLRQLIFDLRPSSLEYGSLAAALRAFLEQVRAEAGTQYRLEDRLAAKLPVQTTALIYRTAQEALVNVRKHARAKTVRVQLLDLDDGCLIRIVDDGVGYDPLEVESRPGHLGLALIQERAQIAGGWSRVESAPGAGTTVEFWVPVGEPLTYGPESGPGSASTADEAGEGDAEP